MNDMVPAASAMSRRDKAIVAAVVTGALSLPLLAYAPVMRPWIATLGAAMGGYIVVSMLRRRAGLSRLQIAEGVTISLAMLVWAVDLLWPARELSSTAILLMLLALTAARRSQAPAH